MVGSPLGSTPADPAIDTMDAGVRRAYREKRSIGGRIRMSNDAIHADGTADGPEHEGPSLGMDTPTTVPPPTLHGPADDPTGSGGDGPISDGMADGPLDETVNAGFDGSQDTPTADAQKGGASGYQREWQDEGADGPNPGDAGSER
ncbi:hypothetical protein GCM10009841_22020 [Microlunatus panaciterrae]